MNNVRHESPDCIEPVPPPVAAPAATQDDDTQLPLGLG
jgi:hypothetical protein